MHVGERRAARGAGLLLLAACAVVPACVPSAPSATDTGADGGAGEAQQKGAPSVMALLRKHPQMVVAAYADVTAIGANSVVAHYGADTSYGQTTPAAVPDANGKATLLLLGLAPDATTHVSVVAKGPGGVARTDDIRIRTDAYPASAMIPRVDVIRDDGTARGYVLATMVANVQRGATDHSTAIMLDRNGRVMWYRDTGGGQALIFDRMVNGDFIVDDDNEHAFHELAVDGTERHVWKPAPPLSIDGANAHEFRSLPDGRAVLIGLEEHTEDTRSLPGGVEKARRLDNNVVEMDASGAGRVIWSTYPDQRLDDLLIGKEPFDPKDYEPAHMNAIDVAPDGNLLVSCRATSSVLKIDRQSGAVIWRMGGVRNEFRFLDDPQSGFSKQHDVRYLPNGHIRLFDNGNLHHPPESRVVEYEIDEPARTVRLVRAWHHRPPLLSFYAGSARDSGDHVLVDFTMQGTLTEFAQDGAVAWEVKLTPYVAYRAEVVDSPYP